MKKEFRKIFVFCLNPKWWPKVIAVPTAIYFSDVPFPPQESTVKAYYISDRIEEIVLPEHLADLPQLGDIEDTGILGYIIIANGEEITIITNEEEYLTWYYQLQH